MSDDEHNIQLYEGEPAESYDPSEYLSAQQIELALKMAMFPNLTKADHAHSFGIPMLTLRQWMRNKHFIAFLAEHKEEMSRRTMEVAAARRAAVMDKLTADLLPRFEQPERDPQALEAILGPNYSRRDQARYEATFVQNMEAKDAVRIWLQMDKNIVDADAAASDNAVEDDDLVNRIRAKHTELKALERRMDDFNRRTWFNFSANIHDEDPMKSYRADIIDVEVIEPDDEDEEAEEKSTPTGLHSKSVKSKYEF